MLQGTPLAGTATGGASISHDISTISELQSIAAAANCAPENQEYKLRTLFLNVVGDPAARIKVPTHLPLLPCITPKSRGFRSGSGLPSLSHPASPGGARLSRPSHRFHGDRTYPSQLPMAPMIDPQPTTVDERQWTEALEKAGGEDNADRLWPVPAVGFRDLRQRAEAQLAAEKDDRERVAAVRGLLRRSEQLRASEITRRLEAAQQRHAEQLYRLLKLLRCLDGLEGRLSVHGASETNESTVRCADLGQTPA